MGSKGKSRVLNPADALRKAQRKRELKKNKEDRKQVRLVATATKDYSKIERELAHLRSQDRQGLLDGAGQSRKQELEERLKQAKDARSKLGLDKDKKVEDKDKPKVVIELDVGKTLDGETVTKKKLLKSAKDKERDRKKEKAQEEKEGAGGVRKRKRQQTGSDAESETGSDSSDDSDTSGDSESDSDSDSDVSRGSPASPRSNAGANDVAQTDDDIDFDAIEISYEDLSSIPLPSDHFPEGEPPKKQFYDDLYLNETRDKSTLDLPPVKDVRGSEKNVADVPNLSEARGKDEREMAPSGRRGPPLPPQNAEWGRHQHGNAVPHGRPGRPPPPPGPPPVSYGNFPPHFPNALPPGPSGPPPFPPPPFHPAGPTSNGMLPFSPPVPFPQGFPGPGPLAGVSGPAFPLGPPPGPAPPFFPSNGPFPPGPVAPSPGMPPPPPVFSASSMYQPSMYNSAIVQQVAAATAFPRPPPGLPPGPPPGPPPNMTPQDLPPPPAVPPASAVISAAPVMRDLRAELTTMVPAALRRKQASLKPKPASETPVTTSEPEIAKPARIPQGASIGPKIPKGFRKMVNTAPDVDISDTEEGDGVVAYGLGQLVNQTQITPKKSQQEKAADEYAEFMKSLEGEDLL